MLLLKTPGGNFSIWLPPKSLREWYSVDLCLVNTKIAYIIFNYQTRTYELVTYSWTNSVLLLKTPGGNFSIWLPPNSLRERYTVNLGWAIKLTSCLLLLLLQYVLFFFAYCTVVYCVARKSVSFSYTLRQNVWDTEYFRRIVSQHFPFAVTVRLFFWHDVLTRIRKKRFRDNEKWRHKQHIMR